MKTVKVTKKKGASVNAAIEDVNKLLEKEKKLSPALKLAIKLLIALVSTLVNQLNLNSNNSSKPPSEDKNRLRKSKREKSNNKPGGQKGHIGFKLKRVENPDRIEKIKVDRNSLPKGQYRKAGYESRQVFDINISREVIEYRAEILEDERGKRFVAEFPSYVKSDVQYGNGVKNAAVYMSQFQLLPYARIQDQFADQMDLSLSVGSLFNFNKEAYRLLGHFDEIAKQKLSASKLLHADETGINVNKKRIWLHTASNDKWTYFYPHIKRGSEAMNEIGVLPQFKGVMCHDHWKPYYKYKCSHALCNAHHIRELTRAEEQDDQKWAKTMKELLLEINEKKACGDLASKDIKAYRLKYKEILANAEKECPVECPNMKRKKGQRGRTKKSKARNLLERLRDYENDVLRFMENDFVPFTNNLGENDLRMTKVQQKISGCFRSIEGAYIFCRIRSYLSTCRKHGIDPTEALALLFRNKLPDFVRLE